MNNFKIRCEHELGAEMILRPGFYPDLVVFEDYEHREFGEGVYGYYLRGFDKDVSFVIHPHFELSNPEIHLYMMNNSGPDLSERLINFVSQIVGCRPIFTEINIYRGAYRPFYKFRTRMYFWGSNPEESIKAIEKIMKYRVEEGVINETSQVLYRDESISDDTI